MRRHKRTVGCGGCIPKPFACDVCNISFDWEASLRRHKIIARCGERLPQPRSAPVNDSQDLRDFIYENWGVVHKHVIKGLVTVDLHEAWVENLGWGSEVEMKLMTMAALLNKKIVNGDTRCCYA